MKQSELNKKYFCTGERADGKIYGLVAQTMPLSNYLSIAFPSDNINDIAARFETSKNAVFYLQNAVGINLVKI